MRLKYLLGISSGILGLIIGMLGLFPQGNPHRTIITPNRTMDEFEFRALASWNLEGVE